MIGRFNELQIRPLDGGTTVRAWISDGSESFARTMAERRTNAAGVSSKAELPGATFDVPYRLVELSRDEVEVLRGYAGVTMLVRDPRGRVVVGFYGQGQIAERPTGSGEFVDVDLTVLALTHPLATIG